MYFFCAQVDHLFSLIDMDGNGKFCKEELLDVVEMILQGSCE